MGKSIATFVQSAELPDHLKQGSGMGNENVASGDLQIARLDLIQQLSPQLQEEDARYIEGAKVGHMFDSLSGDLYESAFLINLYFEKKYQVFKKRALGGGFEGSFESEAAAKDFLAAANLPVEQYDITDTDVHACLLLDANGQPKKPVIIYMSGSKAKVSKAWNTAIATKDPNADRFASVWNIKAVKEKNRQGQPYQNFKIEFAGWANPDLYEEAKNNYLAFRGQQQH